MIVPTSKVGTPNTDDGTAALGDLAVGRFDLESRYSSSRRICPLRAPEAKVAAIRSVEIDSLARRERCCLEMRVRCNGYGEGRFRRRSANFK
jgi:hypothetical protein